MVQADGDVDALATVSEVAQKAAYVVDLSNDDVVDQATADAGGDLTTAVAGVVLPDAVAD